jgi:ABC-type transporter MlaC component
MKVSGIWLVQQMRDAFAGTIRRDNGGIEALFRYLKS